MNQPTRFQNVTLSHHQMQFLRHAVTPLSISENHGIDLYLQTIELLNAMLAVTGE